MKREEACLKYGIPENAARCYENIRKTDDYKDEDINRIGMLMALYDSGFGEEKVRGFISAYLEKGESECVKMLEKERSEVLGRIHRLEKQIENIDYIRYRIKKGGI